MAQPNSFPLSPLDYQKGGPRLTRSGNDDGQFFEVQGKVRRSRTRCQADRKCAPLNRSWWIGSGLSMQS